MTDRSLLISEIFGGVWQGEGRQTGRYCTFVRLSRCNLNCSWCDTPFTWAFTDRQAALHQSGVKYDVKTESSRMEVAQVVSRVLETQKYRGQLVVISGGEPLLQADNLFKLVVDLKKFGFECAIETAGTIEPIGWSTGMVQWNVSPKLTTSGNLLDKRYKPQALKWLRNLGADFKFVITNEYDLFEVENIVSEVDLRPPHIWLMPEGTDAQTVLERAQKLAPLAAERGWNLTLRQHVLLYGDERGR